MGAEKIWSARLQARFLSSVFVLFLTWSLAQADDVAKSPYGPDDEIGVLNELTEANTLAVLQRVSSGKTYDLSVANFVGMPGLAAVHQRLERVFPGKQAGDDSHGPQMGGPNCRSGGNVCAAPRLPREDSAAVDPGAVHVRPGPVHRTGPCGSRGHLGGVRQGRGTAGAAPGAGFRSLGTGSGAGNTQLLKGAGPITGAAPSTGSGIWLNRQDT